MTFPSSGTKPSRSSAAWSSGCSRNRASAIAVPELDQIEVSAAGHVNVSGGTNAGEPVRRLGQLLQAMLGHGGRPFNFGSSSCRRRRPLPLRRSARFASTTRPWGISNDLAVTLRSRLSMRERRLRRSAPIPAAFPRWTLSLRCRRQIGLRNPEKTPLRNRTRVAGS